MELIITILGVVVTYLAYRVMMLAEDIESLKESLESAWEVIERQRAERWKSERLEGDEWKDGVIE